MRNEEEFKRASRSGMIIMHELMEFSDVNTFRSIIAACVETWCTANEYDAREVIASIDDAIHLQHKEKEL